MKMQGRSVIYLAAALAVIGAAFWGCGGGGQSTTEQQTEGTTGQATDTAGGASLAMGDQVFQERCATCHGPEGKGDGPAGQALTPRPRNFQDAGYMSGLSDQQIHDTILNGKPGTAMPPHKGLLTEEQVQALVLKVRSLSKT